MAYKRELLGKVGRMAGEAAGAIDDAVQGGMRRAILGKDQMDESKKSVMQNIASMPFAARPGSKQETAYRFSDDAAGKTAMAASRLLQAGAISGAGAGMMALTNAMMPQPEQNPGTLMPDDGMA